MTSTVLIIALLLGDVMVKATYKTKHLRGLAYSFRS